MGRDAKAQRKAALKRKRREHRVQEARAQLRAAKAGGGGKAILSRLEALPIHECVVSRGWEERGLAHVLLARRAPGGALVVGGYYVDTLCTGLKDTALMNELSEEEYRERVKPNIFNDPVEFEECAPGTARALVEGAVAFAASLGLKPNKRWPESKRLWEGIEADPGTIAFGRNGRPCLIVRGRENVSGVRARLDRTVGAGNYLVEETEALS
ncbi:MAG: hypothetical protein ACNA8S_00395 [Deferrisomatales bacterium]